MKRRITVTIFGAVVLKLGVVKGFQGRRDTGILLESRIMACNCCSAFVFDFEAE